MPRKKSAAKALRQSVRRRGVNARVEDKINRALRELKAAVGTKDGMRAEALLRNVFSSLDKAVKKNVLHKNTASRKKSRLSTLVKKTSSV